MAIRKQAKKYVVLSVCIVSFIVRKAMGLQITIYFRYNPDRVSKYDLRICAELSMGKMSVVLKLLGTEYV